MVDAVIEKDVISEFFDLVQKLHENVNSFRNNHVRVVQQIDQELYEPARTQIELQLSNIEKIKNTVNGVMTIIGILLKVEKYEMDRIKKLRENFSLYQKSFYELINMQRDFIKIVDDLNRLKRNYEIHLGLIGGKKLLSFLTLRNLLKSENSLIDDNQRLIDKVESQLPLLAQHVNNLLSDHVHVLSEHNKEINDIMNDVKKLRLSLFQSFHDYLESNVDYFNNSLGKTNLLIVFYLLSFIKRYDNVTYWHVLRVGLYTYHVATKARLDSETVYLLTVAGILHDLGKIMVPAELISGKKITEEEFKIIKGHPVDGYKFLRIQYPVIAEYVGAHHCYKKDPYGVQTRQQEAIFVAIADVFDALVEKRSYKEPFPPAKVREIMYADFKGYKIYVDYLIHEFQLEKVA